MIRIAVQGKPVSKQSARFVRGRIVSVAESNKKLALWTGRLVGETKLAMAAAPEEAVAIYAAKTVWADIDAYFATPDGSKHGQAHGAKPDKDNVEKAVLDAFKKAGLVRDDCRIAGGQTVKRWGPAGGVAVAIAAWAGGPPPVLAVLDESPLETSIEEWADGHAFD